MAGRIVRLLGFVVIKIGIIFTTILIINHYGYSTIPFVVGVFVGVVIMINVE
jgi:hypothetical protein